MSCPCPCQGDPRQHGDPTPWVCPRTWPVGVGAGIWTLGSDSSVCVLCLQNPSFTLPFLTISPVERTASLDGSCWFPGATGSGSRRAPAVLRVPPVSSGLIRKLGERFASK